MPRPDYRHPQSFSVLNIGENDAEINMYGEVVATRPVDWWTGKPIEGDFIELDVFLKTLDDLAAKDNITVHINSVGGDFYAGLAIYNRLRSLKASITTINDSLAASAGSIIFMAGDVRKVHAGSNLMVHGVMSFMYGYFNVQDLKAQIKTLDAHNKAAIAAYREATGLDEETIKAAMSKDTYMTGQEAVDAGWASEVISADAGKTAAALTPDRSFVMVNGHKVAARCFGRLPETVQVLTEEEAAAQTAQNISNSAEAPPAAELDKPKNQKQEEKNMEFQTVEELRNAAPELVAQIENAARADAVRDERARLQGIEEIAASVGDAALVAAAKFGENPMNAAQLALAAMKQQAAIGAQVMAGMAADAAASGAAAVGADPNGTPKSEAEQATEAAKNAVTLYNRIKKGGN